MSELNVGERFIRWADKEPAVVALVQVGSRVRPVGQVGGPDSGSDWDFQLVTSRPTIFDDRKFLERAGVGRPCAFVNREGRLGSARKITAVLSDGELDLIIIPVEQLLGLREKARGKGLEVESKVMQALSDQALVLADGFRVLKGNAEINEICDFISTGVPLPRISDTQVREIAEGFVCDFVSTIRKIERGELIAAQRWLHHYLIEADMRLLHEFLLRRGRLTFPDARRMESVLDVKECEAFSISTSLTDVGLHAAAGKAANTLQELVDSLVGKSWHWPLKPGR